MAPKKIVVVGAGPVGALAALYAARRNYEVEVYELRDDIRKTESTPLNFTKSINLALSERGISALRSFGDPVLLDKILEETVPMHGRMIHTANSTGKLVEESQAYDVHGRYQRSVDRGLLNKLILNELDRLPNVTMFFHHKLTGADFDKRKAWLEIRQTSSDKSKLQQQRPQEIEITFDLLIGADGAHSATRYHLMKFARMNYSQEYIDCLWCEFTMSPSESGDYRISPNHLHIWPGGSLMFIALPNLDKSFTCTLFAPVHVFRELEQAAGDTSSQPDQPSQNLTTFFNTTFPGITALVPPHDLSLQFRRNPHLPLINLTCSPHHYNSSAVILGDAANAIVPFYGQGMNAGLESVRVLFEHLDQDSPSQSFSEALSRYSQLRTPDTAAIASLALQNYIEMRSSVTSPTYKLRKFIEETLDKYMPGLGWATQYSRVSFGNMRYSKVVERAGWQRRVLGWWVLGLGIAVSGGVLGVLWRLGVLRRLAEKRGGLMGLLKGR